MSEQRLLELGRRLEPAEVRAYLESRGWIDVHSRRPYAALYRSGRQEHAEEVHVPLERSLIDYGEAMVTVARRIAAHEQRSTEAVLHDLLHPRRDLLRFALEGDAMRDGEVSLASGLALVSGVRKALLASACSVRRPRTSFHPRLSLGEAEAFLRECRLGQTEVGSFVLTVEAPLEVGPQPHESSEPFGRQTALMLLRSVASVAAALRAGEPQRLLQPAEDAPVVSANLCEALVEMLPPDEAADLRLRCSWSPLLPPASEAPSEVLLERHLYEPLERVARQLRPARETWPAWFVGKVFELMGSPSDQGEIEGHAVLQVQVDEELLRVRVTLGPADYRQAVLAHLEQRYVTVRGILRRGSRVHLLESASDFKLVGSSQDSV